MNNESWVGRLKHVFIGDARDLTDQKLFHKVSLIAVLAWVGLGADGLSSSCYGPEETFKALGAHVALAPFVALACMVTIGIICMSYSQIIQLFPGGGGGYLVASKLLSPKVGVVSGCALLVDYVLTIAISIASGADQLFSLLPPAWQSWKLPVAVTVTLVLTVLNLRGVRESVLLWAPIFFVFLFTHGLAIVYGMVAHFGELPQVVVRTSNDVGLAHSQLGWLGVFFLLLRAYSVGAGTYTGIEAVSNGLPILREPRVATGRRTMVYMGLSLAITVGGLLVAYLLYRVAPVDGKTLNAVLFGQLTGNWPTGLGKTFVFLAMGSATVLLFIAAQAGFLDGPRVLANMALDRWMPARFATLSDRLVAQNGILIMGAASVITLLVTHGAVALLVVLYSINVFITFSLSQAGMVRHWWQERGRENKWRLKLAINGVGFCLTTFILISLSAVKFTEGGWVTLLVTGAFVGASVWVHSHYRKTTQQLKRLDVLVPAIEADTTRFVSVEKPLDAHAKTAVILVSGFNGLGLHTLLNVMKMFPNTFQNFVFVQAGVVDAGNFKGADEIENLRSHVADEAKRYACYMKGKGFHADVATAIGHDVVEEATELAIGVAKQYPQSVFFGGQLVFMNETWLGRILHNFTVFALQREFFRRGLPFLIVPIRV